MTRDELLAFARRDWSVLRGLKLDYRRNAARTATPLDPLVVVDELRAQVHDARPDWPSAADRAADLEGHILLADRLRRAAAAS